VGVVVVVGISFDEVFSSGQRLVGSGKGEGMIVVLLCVERFDDALLSGQPVLGFGVCDVV
jgi:hypothetical protein